MAWIALLHLSILPPSNLPQPSASPPSAPLSALPVTPEVAKVCGSTLELAHWALQFTPHVACVDEALRERAWQAVLIDAAPSLRLWGGMPRLLARLREEGAEVGLAQLATGSTGLVALARLHAKQTAGPIRRIDDLPLHALSAAWPHLETLHQIGCTTWGQLAAMPRGGITRRFGVSLLDALDKAYGRKSEIYSWLVLPEVFSIRHELQANVEDARGLLFAASRQLKLLQAWLRARHQGIVACQFTWLLDIRRNTPERGEFVLQTAQATQDIKHLERLLAEHLNQIELPAPAHSLQLCSLRCEALPEHTNSLLPDERSSGEPLHYFIERVASKLGAQAIRRPLLRADHRPEATQRWISAAQPHAAQASAYPVEKSSLHTFRPAWLMAEPLPLLVRDDKPFYHGPLQLVQGPERLEASLLVDAQPERENAPEPVARDYFMAWNAHAGLLWIFRERLVTQPGWYLHGLFA